MNSFSSVPEKRCNRFWLGRDVYTNLLASSRINTIQDDDRQENSAQHVLLLPKQSYFSVLDPRLVVSIKMDAERKFEAASSKLSNLSIKATIFMNMRLNVNKRQHYCLYEVHWQGFMLFYWYDTHLSKLLHAIRFPSKLKIGEMETKKVKKHIRERRPT